MEKLLTEVGGQVPSLVVLVVVVWMFLRFMHEMRKEFSETMSSLNQEHINARKITHEIIERNTLALLSNVEGTQKLSSRIAMLEEATTHYCKGK